MRWFGKGLADFIAATPPYDKSPAAAEMARFEWALGIAFDRTDDRAIAADAVMAVPPEAWETIAFAPLPSLTLLPVSGPLRMRSASFFASTPTWI